MLVMMLRTVTFIAAWRWCSACVTSAIGAALLLDALLEPLQLARHPRVEIAEAVGELDHDGRSERSVGRSASSAAIGRAACRRPTPRTRSAISSARRRSAWRSTMRSVGPAEVLDQHDAKRDGDRPQFADRQRLDALIGVDEAAEQVGVEAAVGVGDVGPRDAEDAREARKGTAGELGQLTIISRRQVAPDLENLLLDDVIVVEDPFRRRGDGVAGFDGCGDRTVGSEERGLVFPQAASRAMARRPVLRLDLLGLRQRAGMLLQALGTEKLLANELLIVPDLVPRRGRRGIEKRNLRASYQRNGQSQAWTENVPAPRTNPSTIPAANRSRGHGRPGGGISAAQGRPSTLL